MSSSITASLRANRLRSREVSVRFRSLNGAVALAALLLASTAPTSAHAATGVSIGNGLLPNVAVDASGTAYIAWNGGEPANSTLRFCRLPRGAVSCDAAAASSIPTQGESVSRPFVVVSGSRVVVVQYRYGVSPGVYRFTSNDRGATFTPGAVVGFPPFVDAVAGPGDTLSGITNAFQEGTVFQNVPLAGGSAGTVRAVLSGPNDHPLGGTVGMLDAATPLAVFTNGASMAQFRRYDGSGSLNDAANWTPALDIGYADYPVLAGGPAGLFLMAGTEPGGIGVRKFGGSTFSPGVPLLARGEDVNADLFQDAAGRLHAVVPQGDADGWHLIHAVSDDGVTWSSGDAVLQTDGAIADVRAATAPDHVGVAVWGTGIIKGPLAGTKQIRVAAIGPNAPVHATPDTTPPETTLKKHAKKVKTKRAKAKVKFTFTASEAGATFTCRLDKKPFAPCQSPKKLKVKLGKHRFQVLATDAAGNTDASPATLKFKVVRQRR